MAPGPDGGLYVAISVRKGPAVLVLLDRDGRPRPGWPVAIKGSTWCGLPLPVDDGSVRIICDASDLTPSDPDDPDVRAFAFDSAGKSMNGWPVKLEGLSAYGMGRDLTVFTERSVTDNVTGEVTSHDATITTVGADGTVRHGTSIGLDDTWFADSWAVGPDGVTYGVGHTDQDAEASVIKALDRSGWVAGWPVTLPGYGSAARLGSGGQIVVMLGSAKKHTTRVSVLDAGGASVLSGVLPMATAERTYDVGGCVVGIPSAPLVGGNGSIYVYSELDSSIYGLTPSLTIMKGWPFEPATSLVTARPGLEFEHEAGYCPSPVVPGVGPDGTLVLSLQARTSTVGGSLVAVGTDGLVRAGWPVELKRSGAEFWSVVVGPDGTTYALAIEPEAGGKSSASILAVAPDSTVRWTTTIIDP
ncbi:MAG: hypothetical protein A2Z32_04140 [Chloroflexi bacterium RBG_16_69_14]|nr:MAG: hypothetical protein A2Z32_04140 [Chloroflexi bacterium RBG_16_69_14]